MKRRKKILYISFLDEYKRPGYKMKLHGEARAFFNLNLVSYLITFHGPEKLYLYEFKNDDENIIDTVEVHKNRLSKDRNIIDELIGLSLFFKEVKKIIKKYDIDSVYIRRIIPITPLLLKLLKYLKNNGVFIAYEYPSYPWERDLLSSGFYLFYIIDKIFFKRLIKKIDLLVCFGKYDRKDCDFIETMNGVHVEDYKLKKKRKKGRTINLLAVGHVVPKHGYDKILFGLKKYYMQENRIYNIHFHLVGDMNPNIDLKKMTIELEIDDYVTFHGIKIGTDLDELFDVCDIAIDSLALNRIIHEDELVGTLKSREYLARGIPFIFSGNVDFTSNLDRLPNFLLKVDENKNFLDMNEVVNFYTNNEFNPIEIRNYAKTNLNWEKMLAEVSEKIAKS